MGINVTLPDKAALSDRKKIRRHFLALTRIPTQSLSSDDYVHDLRVTGKRLRAFLQLFRPAIGKDKSRSWKRRLSQGARPLALSRGNRVSQDLLGKLGKEALVKNLGVLAPPSTKPCTNSSAELQKAASTLRKARSFLLREALPVFKAKDLKAELKRSRKQAHRWANKAGNRTSGHILHNWRKSIKQLYYQLEINGDDDNSNHHKEMAQLREMEDRLGKIHDADELKLQLKKSPPLPGKQKLLRNLDHRQEKQARRLYEIAGF